MTLLFACYDYRKVIDGHSWIAEVSVNHRLAIVSSFYTSVLQRLVRRLFGKLFGDCGSISAVLAEQRFITQGIALITKLRKNMRERVLAFTDKLLLRKLAIIESVNDQLKNMCQIEHPRHRSPYNFLAHLLVHLLAGVIAYCHLPKKPSLHLNRVLDCLAAG